MMNKTKIQRIAIAAALSSSAIASADCSVGVTNLASFEFPLICDAGSVRGSAWGEFKSATVPAGKVIVNMNGSGNYAFTKGFTEAGVELTLCNAQDFSSSAGVSASDNTGCDSAFKQTLFVSTL
jgi:hypothetical protein